MKQRGLKTYLSMSSIATDMWYTSCRLSTPWKRPINTWLFFSMSWKQIEFSRWMGTDLTYTTFHSSLWRGTGRSRKKWFCINPKGSLARFPKVSFPLTPLEWKQNHLLMSPWFQRSTEPSKHSPSLPRANGIHNPVWTEKKKKKYPVGHKCRGR